MMDFLLLEKKLTYRIIFFGILALFSAAIFLNGSPPQKITHNFSFFKSNNEIRVPTRFDSALLKKELDNSLKENSWPEMVTIANNQLKIEYTLNNQLSEHIKGLLAKYRSDYSTVVVVDNQTGNIISAVGYDGLNRQFTNHLAFSNTHPSASIFKIITSAELLKKNKVDVDTLFTFTGRSTTLYKNQLRNTASIRWARLQTFRKAFATSNNVIFGKAAINNISAQEIYKTANDFGFNQQLMDEITLPQSFVGIPEDSYEMAQLASGFNKETTMSPVHGALLSSIVANDGVLKFPNLVSKVTDLRGEIVWSKQTKDRRVLDEETSTKIRELMTSTVDEGTARKGFRRMRTLYKQELEIGGKTGHITGGKPFGKRDWFTAFAQPKSAEFGKGISICVMNVNVKRWHVRSSALAKEIIEYYYGKVLPIGQSITKISKKKMNRREV